MPGAAPGIPPKKGLSTGAIIGIIAGALAVVLLIVGGVLATRALFASASSSSSGEEETGSSAKTAEGAVEEYLNALAEGDATTARKIVGGSRNNPLLSDEVLQRSNELAPLTGITIEGTDEQDEYSSIVSTSFKLGDERISRDFTVYRYSSKWELSDGLVRPYFSGFDGLGLTVNGAEPKGDTSEVFIGAYQLELGVDAFEVGGDSDTLLLVSDDDAQELYDLKPVLTEEATAEYRKLVRSSLDECLKSTALKTPCGMDVSGEVDGLTVKDGSVKRTLSADGDATLKNLNPESEYDRPATVSTYEYISVDIAATFSDGSAGTLFGGQTRVLQPYVDFSEEDPTVTWQ